MTPTEKRAIARAKAEAKKDVSNLLREHTLQELIEWGQELLRQDESLAVPAGAA